MAHRPRGREVWSGAALAALLWACQPVDGTAPGGDVDATGNDLTPLAPEVPNLSVTPPGTTAVQCAQVAPGAAESRLLTRLQYDNTIRDLLGDESAPGRSFPPENTLLGFGNNAGAHRASLLLSERQVSAAE